MPRILRPARGEPQPATERAAVVSTDVTPSTLSTQSSSQPTMLPFAHLLMFSNQNSHQVSLSVIPLVNKVRSRQCSPAASLHNIRRSSRSPLCKTVCPCRRNARQTGQSLQTSGHLDASDQSSSQPSSQPMLSEQSSERSSSRQAATVCSGYVVCCIGKNFRTLHV